MDPAGRFSKTYSADVALVRTRPQAVALVLTLIALLVFAFMGSPRMLSVLTSIFTAAIIAVGLQVTTGFAGQVNLGQAAFAGVGAYCTAFLAQRFSVPFYLVIPLSGFAAAGFGWIFGMAAVRIRGFYLALTTIAAQALFPFVILNLPSNWLGGSSGLTVPPATLGSWRLTSERDLYLMALVVGIVMVAGAFGIVRGRHGRAFLAVRDDELAAGMTGIAVARTKAMAFFVGAFYAGVGGALIAYQLRLVNTEGFTLFQSIWFIAMVIVGGLGSIVGGIVGAAAIRGVQEILSTIGPTLAGLLPLLGNSFVFAAMNVFLGGVIVAFLIYEPDGLMRRWSILKSQYRRWPFPR
ncbi:branched-chain amino acid ABC transporter permease [Simplicispira suum]|uniref:Branched-chain amino acid ABC transporter permease n=1 Tax=Simplicispira suum TaxID=2109915 RepID=A0A2S0N346_9BURK|nr:branched-chain amino acid ABC transporter permease [Simplicispira suum]AVO42391.1 branched-chain amino acid ABC transporter permease [Simplicispira suum]